MTFWLNGDFGEDEQAISIADRGFLLGDGVFETLFVRDGTPAFLDAHLARLGEGLVELKIDAEIPAGISLIIKKLAEANGAAEGTASARITVTRGVSERGLLFPDPEKAHATVLITVAPAKIATAPARLILSRYLRNEKSVSARCKTTTYLDNILARNEAHEEKADEAVMLNSNGRIACVSTGNIFAIGDDGVIRTPPVLEGALPGIVRGELFASAGEAGLRIIEEAMPPETLRTSALFITNSLVGLRPAHFDKPWEQPDLFPAVQSWYQRRLEEDLRQRAGTT